MAVREPEDELSVIRLAAALRGWSLKRVAVESGIEYQRVQRLFRGERKLAPDDTAELRRAVGLEPLGAGRPR